MTKIDPWDSPLRQLRREEVQLSHLLYDSHLSLRLITPGRPLAVEARIRFPSVFGFRVLNLEDPQAADYLEAVSENIVSTVRGSSWLESVSEVLEGRGPALNHFLVCCEAAVIEVLAGADPSIDLE